MRDGIYAAISNMSSCIDIPTDVFVSGGIDPAVPHLTSCVDIPTNVFVSGSVNVITILVISSTVYIARHISPTGNFRDSTCVETECRS